MKNIKKIKSGFTLVETGLVLFIASFVGFIAFSQLIKNQEMNKAELAGQQIKLIGDSVNAYIANHYNSISTLSNASGISSDLGPRNCLASNNTCTITTATLVNEGLLPSTYSGKNVYGSGYNIILKRKGTNPYYQINGMITTSTPLKTASKIRYDLLGQAMQKAGIDSGMTNGSSSQVSGFNGSWSANSVDYNNITQPGILAYQAGYGTYNYSVFLRRDGTLPMTGDLNMGNQSIRSALNIAASGEVSSATAKTTGASTVGSYLTVNGNSTLKGATSIGSTLSIAGVTTATGAINANNTLTVAGVSNLKSNLNVGGVTILSGITTANNVLNANNALNVGGVSTLKGAANLNSTLTTNGATRLNSTLNVAGVSTFSNAVNVNNSIVATGNINASGNITSANQIKGASLYSTGRNTVGEYIQLNASVTAGASCSPTGLVSRTSNGEVLSCVNGKWKKPVNEGLSRIFVRVNGKCFIPNAETGYCTCPGSRETDNTYGYLQATVIASYNDISCSGGQNDHCRDNYRFIYGCSN